MVSTRLVASFTNQVNWLWVHLDVIFSRKEEIFEDTRKRRILKGTAFRVCGGVKEV